MSEKKVNTSIHKYEESLSVSAEQITLRFNIDNVHDFRTSVKKMRALLRWLGSSKRSLTASFTAIYHLSGELRNAQILLKDPATEKEELTGFRHWLSARVTRLEEEWYKKYDPRILRRLRKKIERASYKKANKRTIHQFFRKRVNRLNGILIIPSPPDEDLHDVRKILKDMQYVYAWGEKNELIDKGPTGEILKEIGHQAGSFNDRRIAIQLLSTYLEEEKPEGPALAALLETKQKWEEAKEQQKKELIATLKGFEKAWELRKLSGNLK